MHPFPCRPLYRHLFNRHPGHSRLRQPVPYLPWRHYCPPHLIMDVSVALWPDKRKRKRHIKKCLRHFMKNLRFFLNLFPSGEGISYKVKKNPVYRILRLRRVATARLSNLECLKQQLICHLRHCPYSTPIFFSSSSACSLFLK